MTVLFFRVEEVLNNSETEAIAPSGRPGAADRNIRDLRNKLNEMPAGTQLVLYGEWAKDWDFDDSKCTQDGKYLVKKMERRGLHIVDKAEGEDPIMDYIARKHVDHYEILA